MTGIRVPVTRGGQEISEEVEHLSDEELAAGLKPGGFLVGQLTRLFIRLVEWTRDLASNLPYILAHMTATERAAFAKDHARGWAAFEMMHSVVLFRGGPFDEHRREFDGAGKLHIYAGGWHHVYERTEQIGNHVVWQYNDQLSYPEL
jgi:hypothetical protein